MPSNKMTKGKGNRKKYFKKKKKKSQKKIGRTVKVEKAILETLGYRSVFNYPMSFHQLCNFLLIKKKVSPEALRDALDYLVKRRKIGEKGGKYYLYKTRTIPWKKRYGHSVKLYDRAVDVAEILSKIPWIRFIGVTGSVAAFNGTRKDDVDLFIVTRSKRLWLTRGFVFVILKILGLLRTEENPNRKMCPNIFMDEENLAWSNKRRNIYVAHEVIMLHPVFDKGHTYFRFLQENEWAFKYFGNISSPAAELPKVKRSRNFALNTIESWAYKSQVVYMKDRRTKEVVERNMIHFNKVDNTKDILDGFKKVRKRIGLKAK